MRNVIWNLISLDVTNWYLIYIALYTALCIILLFQKLFKWIINTGISRLVLIWIRLDLNWPAMVCRKTLNSHPFIRRTDLIPIHFITPLYNPLRTQQCKFLLWLNLHQAVFRNILTIFHQFIQIPTNLSLKVCKVGSIYTFAWR